MKAQLGLIVQHKETEKCYEVVRIHPYMREIDLEPLPDTHWDFEVVEQRFCDTVDDYRCAETLEDIDSFQITTENYIVV